jgi:hypothetical protein
MAGFVLETNATSSSTFPHPTDDPDEKLRGAFGRTDGDRLFAFLLWELPIDGRFEEGLQGVEPLTFVQCAGSADALTVELREPGESCGGYVLSTLGRTSDETGPRDVAIDWRGNTKHVHHNERWSSDEAADLFLTYWRNGRTLPPGLTKRPVEAAN